MLFKGEVCFGYSKIVTASNRKVQAAIGMQTWRYIDYTDKKKKKKPSSIIKLYFLLIQFNIKET